MRITTPLFVTRARIAVGQWLVGPYLAKTIARVLAAETASRGAVATNLAITKRLKTLLPLMENAVEDAKLALVEATKARQAWAADRDDREACLRLCEVHSERAQSFGGQVAQLLELERQKVARRREQYEQQGKDAADGRPKPE